MTSTQQLSSSEFKTSMNWEQTIYEAGDHQKNSTLKKDFLITTKKIPISIFLSNSKIYIEIKELEKLDHVYMTFKGELSSDWKESFVIRSEHFEATNTSWIAEGSSDLINFRKIPNKYNNNNLKVYNPRKLNGSIDIIYYGTLHFAINFEYGLKTGAKLFMNNEFTDVKIFCEKKTFDCHKLVLASRSEVFKSMLITSKMSETTSGEIKITDITADTMHNFLFFLYHGGLDPTKITGSLLMAAEKYEVLDLVSYCVKTLTESLNEENVIDVMISAHLVNQKTLFYRASQYIFKNSLKEKIKKTDQFKDFQKMYPAQALEMLTSAMLEELDIQPSQEFQKCKLFPADLFMEDELSDVKIFCDEKIFNCHKLVLVSQSEVFKGMLVKEKTRAETICSNLDGQFTTKAPKNETICSNWVQENGCAKPTFSLIDDLTHLAILPMKKIEKTSDTSSPPVNENPTEKLYPSIPPVNEEPTEQPPIEIKITDTSSSTMFNLLFFLYHGKLDEITKISGSLLVAAEKYKLTGLFNICERYLMKNLSEKNVVEVLISTYMINKRDVFGHACKFIFKNNLNDKIVKTEEWCNFQENNPTQALELLTEAMFQ